MPSRTSHNTLGESGSKQSTKALSGTTRSGQDKDTLAVERTRYGHDGHGSSEDQPAKKSQKAVSVAIDRWLDEPLAQGPFVVLGDVVGWEAERADSNGGKKRSGHKGKNKKI